MVSWSGRSLSYKGKAWPSPANQLLFDEPSNWNPVIVPEPDQMTKDYIGSQIPIYSDVQKVRSQYDYYRDYYKNTGIRPRYPYLTYQDYTTPALYSALGMASHAGYKLLTPKKLYG